MEQDETESYEDDAGKWNADDQHFDYFHTGCIVGILNTELAREKRLQIVDFPHRMPADGGDCEHADTHRG